jgi:hypothetical protein
MRKFLMLFAVTCFRLTKRSALMVSLVCAFCSHVMKKPPQTDLKIEGFRISVKLPMNDGAIDNQLYSERIVSCLPDFWMSRPLLWSRAVIAVCEDAFGKRFFANSQCVEGVINQELNHQNTFKEDISSLSALMH